MVKNPPANAGDLGSTPVSGRSPREGNGNLLKVYLPGKSHGHKSLAHYSPWRVGHDLAAKQQRLSPSSGVDEILTLLSSLPFTKTHNGGLQIGSDPGELKASIYLLHKVFRVLDIWKKLWNHQRLDIFKMCCRLPGNVRAHLVFMVMNLSETSYRLVWSKGCPKWWALYSDPLLFIEHWEMFFRGMGFVLVTPGWRKEPCCAPGAQNKDTLWKGDMISWKRDVYLLQPWRSSF